MKPPHILVIAQYFPPDVAGTSTRAYNAVKGLMNHGCRVTVLTAFPHYPSGNIPKPYRRKIISQEKVEGISVIRTWVPPISHYSYTKRIIVHGAFILSSLQGLFKIRRIDVIISMNPSLFSFLPAFVFKLVFRKKIIRNLDDLWPEVWYDLGIIRSRIFKRILDGIAKMSYDIPVAITPISNSVVQTLTEKYHVPESKIFVIEHGVDTSKFHCFSNVQQSEQDFSIPDEDKVRFDKAAKVETMPTAGIPTKTNSKIVYSGALSMGYDFEPVIRAAKLLENDEMHFILRGAGTSANDVGVIRDLINELGVKNVEVRTDRLSAEDLIKFLNDADIFILPMSFLAGFDIGLPTKVLEYQAMGKPIVCISNGEAADYITRTQSGLVSRTKDPYNIAMLIRKLVNERDLAGALGNNGFTYIQQNLTIEKVGARFMNIISNKCYVDQEG